MNDELGSSSDRRGSSAPDWLVVTASGGGGSLTANRDEFYENEDIITK